MDIEHQLLSLSSSSGNGSFASVDNLEPHPVWLVVFLWIMMIVLSLETILGNVLVLMAYKLERNIRRQLSNKFIISLAISDLIIGMEGFPMLTIYVVNKERWPLGTLLCQTWLCIDYMLCLVSILTVLLITVDRYCSVCYPAKYRMWQSPNKIHTMIVISWILPLAFFGLVIFGWEVMTGIRVEDPTKCYAPFLNDPFVNMTMYIVYYWTTLVAMSVLYRGIHVAAKTLEDKSKAKQKQTLALMLGQRCMAQVGVGMFMNALSMSEREPTSSLKRGVSLDQKPGLQAMEILPEYTELIHDSGYITAITNTATTTTTSVAVAPQKCYESNRLNISNTCSDNLHVVSASIEAATVMEGYSCGSKMVDVGQPNSEPMVDKQQPLIHAPIARLGEDFPETCSITEFSDVDRAWPHSCTESPCCDLNQVATATTSDLRSLNDDRLMMTPGETSNNHHYNIPLKRQLTDQNSCSFKRLKPKVSGTNSLEIYDNVSASSMFADMNTGSVLDFDYNGSSGQKQLDSIEESVDENSVTLGCESVFAKHRSQEDYIIGNFQRQETGTRSSLVVEDDESTIVEATSGNATTTKEDTIVDNVEEKFYIASPISTYSIVEKNIFEDVDAKNYKVVVSQDTSDSRRDSDSSTSSYPRRRPSQLDPNNKSLLAVPKQPPGLNRQSTRGEIKGF